MKKETTKKIEKNKETTKKVGKKKEVVKKAEKKKEVKTGYFKNLMNELSKVKWPDSKEVIKYSLATFVFLIILALFFEGFNIIHTLIKGLFN